MYQNPDSFSDVKVSNENVALIDHQISRNNIMSNDGFTPLFITDYFPTSEQYYLDVVNGIATIQANCEIKEVQVIINGITKFYKLIPDEEIATTNDSVQPSSQPKSKHRHKRRTPSKEEKRYYKKYGDRFFHGDSSCRNEIIKEILEYQSTHPDMEWKINDRNGLYNFLFNNCVRNNKYSRQCPVYLNEQEKCSIQ